MSWHVTLITKIDDARAKLEAARSDALAQNPECGDQFAAARDAAITILLGQSVGGYDKTFAITMTGHVNPDHAPREGWANDFVNVAILQV